MLGTRRVSSTRWRQRWMQHGASVRSRNVDVLAVFISEATTFIRTALQLRTWQMLLTLWQTVPAPRSSLMTKLDFSPRPKCKMIHNHLFFLKGTSVVWVVLLAQSGKRFFSFNLKGTVLRTRTALKTNFNVMLIRKVPWSSLIPQVARAFFSGRLQNG